MWALGSPAVQWLCDWGGWAGRPVQWSRAGWMSAPGVLTIANTTFQLIGVVCLHAARRLLGC